MGLESRNAMEIVTSDLKLYKAGDFNFAIAQAEVTSQMQLTDNLGACNRSTQYTSRATWA